jgi:hypothetical protein
LADPETPYIADLDAYLTKQGIDHSLFPVWCPVCGKGYMHNIYQVLSFHDPPPELAVAA